MQEHKKYQGEELIEVNVSEEGRINSLSLFSVGDHSNIRYSQTTEEYKDVFEWIYAEIPRLNPHLITNQLNLKE